MPSAAASASTVGRSSASPSLGQPLHGHRLEERLEAEPADRTSPARRSAERGCRRSRSRRPARATTCPTNTEPGVPHLPGERLGLVAEQHEVLGRDLLGLRQARRPRGRRRPGPCSPWAASSSSTSRWSTSPREHDDLGRARRAGRSERRATPRASRRSRSALPGPTILSTCSTYARKPIACGPPSAQTSSTPSSSPPRPRSAPPRTAACRRRSGARLRPAPARRS